jgi:hypothetical protein
MRPYRYSLLPLAALLALALPAQAQYGIGVVAEVPLATGPITLDGDASEPDWANATEVDLTAYWNSGFYDCAPNAPGGEQDITATGLLLHDEGVLYIHITVQDYLEFYWGPPGEPYLGEYLIVGVDLTHEEDDQIDPNYSGWPDNYPNLGPVAYKISGFAGEGNGGLTHDWGFSGLDPVGDGVLDGSVFIDEGVFQWGVELAIYAEEVATGTAIGFNIGGAAGHEECALNKFDDYAYYSWQAVDPPGSAGGDVMNNSASFATLEFVETVANEGGPDAPAGFAVGPNVPNPFRGTTTLTYTMPQAGEVELAGYDVLGRRVAVLDAGARAAGEHPAVFDAAALPAGVYTLRLAVDGAVVASRRVMHAH